MIIIEFSDVENIVTPFCNAPLFLTAREQLRPSQTLRSSVYSTHRQDVTNDRVTKFG